MADASVRATRVPTRRGFTSAAADHEGYDVAHAGRGAAAPRVAERRCRWAARCSLRAPQRQCPVGAASFMPPPVVLVLMRRRQSRLAAPPATVAPACRRSAAEPDNLLPPRFPTAHLDGPLVLTCHIPLLSFSAHPHPAVRPVSLSPCPTPRPLTGLTYRQRRTRCHLSPDRRGDCRRRRRRGCAFLTPRAARRSRPTDPTPPPRFGTTASLSRGILITCVRLGRPTPPLARVWDDHAAAAYLPSPRNRRCQSHMVGAAFMASRSNCRCPDL